MSILKSLFKFISISLALFLILIPYGVKIGAVYYLENEKKLTANIGDVTFNLITGKFGLKDVHVYGEHSGELHLGEFEIDISMQALFSKNILIESVVFRNFKSNVTEVLASSNPAIYEAWNVGGILIPIATEEKVKLEEEIEPTKTLNWGYGVRSIAFSNIELDVSSQYTDSVFLLNTFKFKDAISWFPDGESDVEFDLNINGQNFRLDGELSPFMNVPVINTRVKINDVKINPFLKSVKNIPFDDASVFISADFKLNIALQENNIQLNIDGEYGLKDIYLKDELREIKVDKFAWQGTQKINLPSQGEKTIFLDGGLLLEKMFVQDFENNVKISQEIIVIDGDYQITVKENSASPEVTAITSVKLGGLIVDSLDGDTTLLSFTKWDIGEINVRGLDDVAIQKSELQGLNLLASLENNETPAVVSLDKLIVNNVVYNPLLIEVDKIEFQHLNADIRLNSEGEISALSTFNAKDNSEKALSESEQAVKPENSENEIKNQVDEKLVKSLGFNIGEIELNSDSKIRFVDHSVTPIFETQLYDLKIQVKDINTLNDQNPVAVNFGVKIDEYGTFVLKGDVQPFSEKMNAKLIAKIEGLELVPLSSYTSKFAGLNIKRGTLGIDADIDIKNDVLDVKNTFYMNQLTVESNKNEREHDIFIDMPMPLDLTLDVLRDKNNLIKLNIPVKGDVNNPNFKLQDVYNTAMAKALKFAATHYLMQAVQPLGLILTAGKLAGKAMVPKFDPLQFTDGKSDISTTNQKHIKKLAKILQEKDKLRFTICGTATESDWKVLQRPVDADVKKDNGKADLREQLLLKLANDRTKLVKKVFVEEYKIKPARLFACNGKIVKNDDDHAPTPVVEITL